MAADAVDWSAIAEPISPDEPCGPDLDLDGDPDYFQAVSRIEGLLPAAFFTRNDEGQLVAFDRSKIDFGAEFRALSKLLTRTRDLRLLTLYGRLGALARDLRRVSEAVTGASALIQNQWADVHPKGEGSDYGLRTAVLQWFDDMPTMVLPFQHVPLATSRRSGPIHFRSIMAVNGEAQAAEGEPALDKGGIDRAFAETELDALKETRDRLVGIRDAIDAIRVKTMEEAGFEGAATLDRLPALVGRLIAAVDPVVASRDPGAGLAGGGGDQAAEEVEETSGSAAAAPRPAPARPAGAIATLGEARGVLGAVAAYLVASEPSSPALALVRQAEAVIGKSFVDVMRALLPAHAEEVRLAIGADRVITLSFAQLSEVLAAAGEGQSESSGSDDGWGSDDTEASEEASEPEPAVAPVSSRPEAVAAIGRVSTFFRLAEPSSPVPLLLDRAVGLIERDFIGLLKDVLPGLFVKD